MSWIKIEDGFPDHPKFLKVGPVCGYVALAAMAWSNRNLTDGFIPNQQVPRLANLEGICDEERGSSNDYVHTSEIVAALVEAGLWDPAEDGFQIHDYHDHQPTADSIKQRRQKDAARKAHGKARDSKATPNGFHAESTVQEVRSKKEEGTPPLTPPPGGNRIRDRKDWEDGLIIWSVSAGVSGPNRDVVLKALKGAAPWAASEPPEAYFRRFCRQYFPSLTVIDPGEKVA